MYPTLPADSYQKEPTSESMIRDISDFRTLKFFASYINSRSHNQPIGNLFFNEKATLKKVLINYLVSEYRDPVTRGNIIDELLKTANNNLIQIEEFDWLKENENACCAIWGYLSSTPNKLLNINSQNNLFPIQYPEAIFYHQLQINPMPTSNLERFECIRNYFDLWINTSASIKSNFMFSLKNLWISSLKAVKTFTWLTKAEKEQCEWAWNYLNDYHRKETAELRPGIRSINSFNPINDHEKFLAIYAALRIWRPHIAEKNQFIRNINRAWRERQRRKEQEDKKVINTYVSIKVKQKLDLLARYNRCKINEVLSDLINKEYKRLEDDIKQKLNIE